MSDSNAQPHLALTVGTDTSNVLANERQKYLIEIATQNLSVFVFFSVPVFAVSLTINKRLFKIDAWFAYSLAIGVIAGSITLMYVAFVLRKQFRTYPETDIC